MPVAADRAGSRSAADVQAAIERFLIASRQPALLEPGEELLPLTAGNFVLEIRGTRLILQAWDRTRNFVRRVAAVKHESRGRLELTVERFAHREGSLFVLDLAVPAGADLGRRSPRRVFREQFRHMLSRQFPGWKVEELTVEPDLQHSLSPAYPRALLKDGQTGWAAIAGGPDTASASGVLSFGLVWLDYLRRREQRLAIEGLALFVPCGYEQPTCLRLNFLNRSVSALRVFGYSGQGFAAELDPRDFGNLETRLEICRGASTAPPNTDLPEAWLEAQVRAHIQQVDATLRPHPVYNQVPAFAGGSRGILDLLAADHRGRLAVLELKATADIHLPFQALDYWMRVKWHLDRSEFTPKGYFPGIALRNDPPRLLLVCPALEFHPTSEALLRCLSTEVEVERIGVSMEWRRNLEIMFRFQGGDTP
jgi:hypothetical protein